jgi:hypothetical protein
MAYALAGLLSIRVPIRIGPTFPRSAHNGRHQTRLAEGAIVFHGRENDLILGHWRSSDLFLGHQRLDLLAQPGAEPFDKTGDLVVSELVGDGLRLPIPKSLIKLLAGFIPTLTQVV